ncbi:MAG: hypothetical protein LBT15_07445 [Synergistaceae bacterium]|jgi:hypothetical protein|nr:hypothetical protein [Synergistaceae bacterium]
MEIVRQIVDSRIFDNIIPLPESFQNRKVELIIMPAAEQNEKNSLPGRSIDSMLDGSITQSLLGAVPHPDLSPADIRAERLSKYERAD